jgi:hypothetical protein
MIVEPRLGYFPVETMLLRLLERNRHNRMAFEYLMAHYLLTRQLDKFALHIKRLADFDYPDIPRHYEEAMLLLIRSGRQYGEFGLENRQISWETQRRFNNFSLVVGRHLRDKEAARNATMPGFGDTYCFYYLFGSPVIKHPSAVASAQRDLE